MAGDGAAVAARRAQDEPSTSQRDGAVVTKTAAAKPKKPHTLASALSGAISGSLVSACVQPLDVVRTKMQGDIARGVARGTFDTFGAVLKEQGVRGFWAGTGPSVIRVGLGAGLHFVLLEQMRSLLTSVSPDGTHHLSNMGAALSGGLSRAVAAILLCPITVVKTRMEYVPDPSLLRTAASSAAGSAAAAAAAPLRYRHTFDALSTIMRTEGVRGLFSGLGPTVLTNAPYSGLYYMFYTRLREGLAAEGRPQAVVNFTSGVAAAVAATLLTQPADVVRTRMQLGLAGTGAATAGAWSTLGTVMRQGPAALMTGAGPRIVKRTAQTALVWTLYEELVPRISALGAAAWEVMEQHKPRPPA